MMWLYRSYLPHDIVKLLIVSLAMAAGGMDVNAQDTAPAPAPALVLGPEKPTEVEVDSEPGMARAFADLADSQDSVRDEARSKLMALPTRYLPSLKKLVEQSQPLKPSQAVALRGIVRHIFLAGDRYPANSNFGFLGIRMGPAIVKMPSPVPEEPIEEPIEEGNEDAPPQPEPDPQPEEQERPDIRIGIMITDRLPGFVGSRLLLDGDIILGLNGRPDLEFPNTTIFSEAIKETPAGKPVTFRLLRRGQVVNVEIPLDPRPDVADAPYPMNLAEMEQLNERRRREAEAFWQKTFGPLMKEAVG